MNGKPVTEGLGARRAALQILDAVLRRGQTIDAASGAIRNLFAPDRALAVAIHASLPVLEAIEKIARPRWLWLSHSRLRQALGLFVLLMALGLAFPLFGLGSLHATSIFVIALGMAEQDGLAMLAAEAGYADQAHMSRELRALTGRSPATLLREAQSTLALSDLFKTEAAPAR